MSSYLNKTNFMIKLVFKIILSLGDDTTITAPSVIHARYATECKFTLRGHQTDETKNQTNTTSTASTSPKSFKITFFKSVEFPHLTKALALSLSV